LGIKSNKIWRFFLIFHNQKINRNNRKFFNFIKLEMFESYDHHQSYSVKRADWHIENGVWPRFPRLDPKFSCKAATFYRDEPDSFHTA
jgi:hypothetical protein